jgi:hypothetical protein
VFVFMERCEMEVEGRWEPCRTLVPLGSPVPGIMYVLYRLTDNMRCIQYLSGEYVEVPANGLPVDLAVAVAA